MDNSDLKASITTLSGSHAYYSSCSLKFGFSKGIPCPVYKPKGILREGGEKMKITTNLKAGFRVTPWSLTIIDIYGLTPWGLFHFFA